MGFKHVGMRVVDVFLTIPYRYVLNERKRPCGSFLLFLNLKRKRISNTKKDPLPSVSLRSQVLLITGLAGFEPANVGVKVLCLTPWR